MRSELVWAEPFSVPRVHENRDVQYTTHLGVPMIVTDRIEIDPAVMTGKPVIRGTRIPVELILRKLAEGATREDLFDAYPRLTWPDLSAALRYAADALAHEETLVLQGSTKS